jgi:hypothetical protein
MEKHEQLDALEFDVVNICTDVQDKLVGDINGAVLSKYLTNLQITVNRYLSEFDINLYEIVGMLESIKLDLLIDEESVAPDIIGVIESVKLGLLVGDGVSFESDIDLEDEDDELEDLY